MISFNAFLVLAAQISTCGDSIPAAFARHSEALARKSTKVNLMYTYGWMRKRRGGAMGGSVTCACASARTLAVRLLPYGHRQRIAQ